MAYETYEKLEYKAKAGISVAKQELANRKNNKVKLPLPGIHGAALYYVPDDSLNEQLFMIEQLYGRVSNKQRVEEVILQDAYYSAVIEGAETTLEQVTKVIASPETKSDKWIDITFFIDYFLEMVIDCLMDTIREDIRLNEKDQKLLQKMRGKEMEK